MKEIVFLDIETTGLEHYHKIFEVAIIGKDFVYEQLVQIPPEQMEFADPVALEITSFSERDFSGAITQRQLAIELADLLKNKIIVAHNVNFDCNMIEELLFNHGINYSFHNRKIDTIAIAFEHLSVIGLHSLSLSAIRTFFGWSQEHAHSALSDAKDVQRLYNKLARCTWLDRLFWKYRFVCTKLLKKLKTSLK